MIFTQTMGEWLSGLEYWPIESGSCGMQSSGLSMELLADPIKNSMAQHGFSKTLETRPETQKSSLGPRAPRRPTASQRPAQREEDLSPGLGKTKGCGICLNLKCVAMENVVAAVEYRQTSLERAGHTTGLPGVEGWRRPDSVVVAVRTEHDSCPVACTGSLYTIP
jgi:hypothetical protein